MLLYLTRSLTCVRFIYIYIEREREREREREYKEPRDGGRVLTSLHVATH